MMTLRPTPPLKKAIDNDSEFIQCKAIKAGRRTYFFDVRATQTDDYFLTITESCKKRKADGTVLFDRHQIFLYKEDFAKFCDGLLEIVDFIKQCKPEFCVRPSAGERSQGL